jgi:hypothetical protein
MRSNFFRIGLVASLLLAGGAEPVRAQALPELSGRTIGPQQDPRLRRRMRRQQKANRSGSYHELRGRRHQFLRSVRLKGGGWRFYGAGWTAHVAADGSVTFDGRSVTWAPRKTLTTFDVTDSVLRSKKKDPYTAAKLRFVRESASWRRGLRRAEKRRVRRAYFAQLPSGLNALWKRKDITSMRKRALLFRLWEECLEPGRTTETVLAQQARWMIQRFIRKHLPRGSSRAYTKRELSWMGKRRQGLPGFDPYGKLRRPVLLKQIDSTR